MVVVDCLQIWKSSSPNSVFIFSIIVCC